MPIPDSFDPLMMLSSAKNVGEGGVPASPGETDRTVAEKFDGAATSAVNIEIPGAEKPLSTDGGYGGPPADVDRFNGGSI